MAWSLPVASNAVLDLIADRDQKVTRGATALIEAKQGPRVVDLTTGETAVPAKDEVFACASEPTGFEYAMPYFLHGRSITHRFGGPLLRSCTAEGADTPAFTVAALNDGGVPAGEGRAVLATSDGLLGFEVP